MHHPSIRSLSKYKRNTIHQRQKRTRCSARSQKEFTQFYSENESWYDASGIGWDPYDDSNMYDFCSWIIAKGIVVS